MNNNIHIFYHCYLVNNCISVIGEQMRLLKKTGLAKEACTINISLIGTREYCEFVRTTYFHSLGDNVNVFFESDFNMYEYPAIKKLWDMSNTVLSPSDLVFYFHTKGVTQPYNQAVGHWRDLLNYFNIERYQDAIDSLNNAAYNTYGVNWHKNHYSGNFWWTYAGHIQNLTEPVFSDTLEARQQLEYWVSGYPNMNPYLKPYCAFESGVNHYTDLFPRERYVKD